MRLSACAFDGDAVDVAQDERSQTVVAHGESFDAPELDAAVGVVTGGTSDAPYAGEAAVIARKMGAIADFIKTWGVDHLDTLRDVDALVVAAGREGALPTVVAGLVNTPVIGCRRLSATDTTPRVKPHSRECCSHVPCSRQ